MTKTKQPKGRPRVRPLGYINLHDRWYGMYRRCYDKTNPDYPNWGGRGIKVCDSWLDFNNFKEDMASTYSKELTLDRINNDKNYSKENCRWVSRKVQINNSRTVFNSEKITYMGICDSIANWAKYIGIKRNTLGMRIQKYGWSIEKSLTTGGLIG